MGAEGTAPLPRSSLPPRGRGHGRRAPTPQHPSGIPQGQIPQKGWMLPTSLLTPQPTGEVGALR